MSMFCYQCQEAAGGKGCTIKGVCGKEDTTAKLQDLLIYVLKGTSQIITEAKKQNTDYNFSKVDDVVLDGLFTTITNANFDNAAITTKVKEAVAVRNSLKSALEDKGVKFANLHDSATWTPSTDAEITAKSENVGVLKTENEDVRSLRETYNLRYKRGGSICPTCDTTLG
jgi:hydroxylamine reductase